MRDIKTLTLEEIEDFLNKTELGDYKIVSVIFDEEQQEWIAYVKTIWEGGEVEGDDALEIEDYFTFNINKCDTSFPFNFEEVPDYILYHEFMLAKGFRENRFEIV